MAPPAETVVVECPAGSPVPAWRVAGMTVLERAVREARRSGATQVLVRADDAQVGGLDLAAAGGEPLAPDAPAPAGARVVRGDEVAGHVIDPADPASRRRAEWALMETCRRPYDGVADRYLWRALSLRITRVVTRTEVTPNQVTVVAALLGLLGCGLVALGGSGWVGAATAAWWVRAGGLALLLGLVLDSVDGELARVRLKFSTAGMILDNVADDVVDTLFLAATGLAAGGVWRWVGLAAAGARVFVAAIIYMGAARAGRPGDVMAFRWWFESGQETTEVFGNPLAPLTLLRSLGRHDAYVTLYGAFTLAAWPLGVVVLGTINAAGYFALACLHLILGRGRSVRGS